MKNVKDAKFIESLISQNDLKSFVCSNRDDLKLFLDEVCYSISLIIIITFSHRRGNFNFVLHTKIGRASCRERV